VALALIIGIFAGMSLQKEVIINDNGNITKIWTLDSTLGQVMLRNGIRVESYDYLSVPVETHLKSLIPNYVNIKRAVPVYITADSDTQTVMTYADTVSELLTSGPVKAAASDRVEGASMNSRITPGMQIQVIRVQEKQVTEQIALPFRVDSRQNMTMDKGTQKVIREGQQGVREKTFNVVIEDGIEKIRNLLSDVILSQPISKLIEYGTIMTHKISRGDVIRYTKVLDMKATAYTSDYADTGKRPGDPYFGITYTGVKAQKGIIAVDPRVIPLHSRVYVEVAGKIADYGYAVAGDIGSAIKGNLIDLYFDDPVYSNRWGCKRVKVYILLE